jgi:hypothetical protein
VDLLHCTWVWAIPSFHEWSVAERVERRWISLTSGRNLRSSIRTSASTCFFRFNLKTKHVDFIHSFACQCHVYYTKYYNATCNAVNPHLFKTAFICNIGAIGWFIINIQLDLFWHQCLGRQAFDTPRMYTFYIGRMTSMKAIQAPVINIKRKKPNLKVIWMI